MNILLINTGQGLDVFTGKSVVSDTSLYVFPIGVLYVAKSLEEEGHKVVIIDWMYEKNPVEEIRKKLHSVDVVGLSIYTYYHEKSLEILKCIKEFDPDIPVVIGGPHCTFYPEKALHDFALADICVEGEGEFTIKHVIKALQENKKLDEISGVHYRKHKKIYHGKPSKVIKDLDSISFPSRHLVDKYLVSSKKNIFFKGQKITSIITSRGCPFKCRFCTRNVSTMNTFRQRSAENVIKELEEINGNYQVVAVVDDNFLADKKRAHTIFDNIIGNGFDFEILIYGARVDSAEKELYNKMKKAGVTFISYGIESGNQDVLDFYNKQITLSQISKAVKLSNKMGFFTIGTFIIGAPFETKQHIENTIQFARSLPLDVSFFLPLTYQKGSYLWDMANKNGKISEDDGYLIVSDSKRGLGDFTSDDIYHYCNRAFKKVHFTPKYLMRQVYKSLKKRDFTLLKQGFVYYKMSS